MLINSATADTDGALARVTFGPVLACSPKKVNKQLKLKSFLSSGTLMKINDFNVEFTPVRKDGS